MFSLGTATGFYNAPVSKGILTVTGTGSLVNLILFSHVKKFLGENILANIKTNRALHILAHPFYFSTTKDFLCGCILLYCFRLLERRFGSTKFTCHVFAISVLAAGLQLSLLHLSGDEKLSIPTGPFSIIYGLFVPFFLDVPSVDGVTFLGIPVSSKLMTYVFGLHLMSSGPHTVAAALSGVAAGLLYRWNILSVQSILKIPSALMRLASVVFSPFVTSSPPHDYDRPIGATLEIQRQLRYEEVERQMWRARSRNSSRQRGGRAMVGQGYADVLVPPDAPGAGLFWNHNNDLAEDYDHIPNNLNFPQQPEPEISEDQVQRLVDMGFSRVSVLNALSAAHNDITVATNILLSE